MKKIFSLLFGLVLSAPVMATPDQTHYSAGSIISEQVTVFDAKGEARSLRRMLEAQAKPVNIVFIFGGGALGYKKAAATGGLWCPDSFEDLHILRSLNTVYKDQVGFFPVAVPPAHHTKYMGYSERVFLQPDGESDRFQEVVGRFMESTQKAVTAGIIPVPAYYDNHFNFMISAADLERRSQSDDWQGAFRARNEVQTYGVPSLWLVGKDGQVLSEPFRGNVYHEHGEGIKINYTLSDVDSKLSALLSRE